MCTKFLCTKFDPNWPSSDIQNESAESFAGATSVSRICVVPRGTLEAYRYFEGLRYGCVVISEVLPPHWFHDGAPHIEIGSWRGEAATNGLRRNPR